MTTPRLKLQGQIKTDITVAAEEITAAKRELSPLLNHADVSVVARVARAIIRLQSGLRILESRGAETSPIDEV